MPTRTLLASFTAAAERRPQAEALVWRDQRVGYGELMFMARENADQLADAGIGGRQTVTVLPHKTPETVALLLAAFMRDLTVLIPAPSLTAPAVQRLHRAVGGSRILSASASASATATATATATASDTAQTNADTDTDTDKPTTPEPRQTPGLLLTTSGTTGDPKVVVLDESGIDAFLAWSQEAFEITPDATVLSYAPLSFDLSLLELWAALGAGARVVLVDEERATDADHLLDLVCRTRPTVIQAVPLVYRLLDQADPAVGQSVPDTRHVISTGDRLPAELARSIARRFPSARIYNVYGSTETNDSFLHEFVPGSADDGPIPIGRPIAGTRFIVEPGSGEDPLARADAEPEGELWTATPFQSSGYLNQSLTRERFAERGDRVYFRTGDRVRVGADGTVSLLGRTDFHTKIRGVRVDMQGVEHVLTRHPQILDAAVVEIPDPIGGSALHAQIQRAPDSALNGLGVREFCRRSLAREAVPSSYRITEEPLPRTANGKVDRALVTSTRQEGRNHGHRA